MLGEQIKQWREESRECIREGFKSVFALMPQQSAQADAAKDLIWGVIDQVFRWTKDRNTSTRFQEWLHKAGFSPPFEMDGLMDGLEGSWLQTSIPDQLDYDFRTEFERVLTQLRHDAFSTLPSTALLASSADGAPELYTYVEPEGDAKTVGIARARLVQHIRAELDYFRPIFAEMVSKDDLEGLAQQHPKQMVFRERRNGKLLLAVRYDLLRKMAYPSLANYIASAVAHRAPTTMETAWKDYHTFLTKAK